MTRLEGRASRAANTAAAAQAGAPVPTRVVAMLAFGSIQTFRAQECARHTDQAALTMPSHSPRQEDAEVAEVVAAGTGDDGVP